MTGPVDELRALHTNGRLAAEYPRVAPLLAELMDAPDRDGQQLTGDLVRCGRLLARLPSDDVLARHPGTPRIAVAVTGHSTTAELIDPLTAELARHGLLARITVGDHGAYLRDLTEPNSELYSKDAELTLCVLDCDAVLDQLPLPWQVSDVERACERLLEQITVLAQAHDTDGTGALILNTFPLPRSVTQQIIDQHQRALLGAVWREFNARLLRLTTDHPSLAVVDLDPLIAESGPATDPRLALYTRSTFTAPVFAALAREAVHVLRARRGMTKKCLVVDLDNTLWRGVLSEGGPDGIECGHTLDGEPYAAVQRAVKQLAAQGVLLAVSSKNDDGPVRDVLCEHPDMTLRTDDFVAVRANWEPKDTNLRAIAAGLGIAADSLVFADDSAAERALIRRHLPTTPVVPLGSEPALHLAHLLADGWFDTPHVTDDDVRRTGQYHAAAARTQLREGLGSYDAYLHELEVEVHISPPERHELRRMSQLSLRTNQFNLTGERVPPERIVGMSTDPGRRLLAVRVRDRFGDSGLVGAVFAREGANGIHIDNMLLSCRALARGVEQGCLTALLTHARSRGLPAVTAGYQATRSNGRARDFYPSLGFTEDGTDVGRGTTFRHNLAHIPDAPGHLRLRVEFEGEANEPRRQYG